MSEAVQIPVSGILVTRLNANSPITEGPFASQGAAEARGKVLKSEYPTSEIVFSTITARVVENPIKYMVEAL